MKRMSKEERKRAGMRISKKTVLRKYSIAWWGAIIIPIVLAVVILSIPGSIDAASGLVPR